MSLIVALVQELLKIFVGGVPKRPPPGGKGLRSRATVSLFHKLTSLTQRDEENRTR